MNLPHLPRREFLVRALAACGAPFLAEADAARPDVLPEAAAEDQPETRRASSRDVFRCRRCGCVYRRLERPT